MASLSYILNKQKVIVVADRAASQLFLCRYREQTILISVVALAKVENLSRTIGLLDGRYGSTVAGYLSSRDLIFGIMVLHLPYSK